MKPYNPKATCPKCGHDDITTSFARAGYMHGLGRWNDEECLVRCCTCCGFTWEEAPLDAQKENA